MKKKLFIFSNESIFLQESKFYCDNIDLKSTPEGLNKNDHLKLLIGEPRQHEFFWNAPAARVGNSGVKSFTPDSDMRHGGGLEGVT